MSSRIHKLIQQSGQSLVGMLVASAISIIILLAVTDLLNYMERSKRSNELSLEFTLWKSTITGLIRNQDQCSAAFSGNVVDTNSACPGANNVTISWPAGCSNSTYVNKTDCQANAGTWTAKDFIKTGTASTVGLMASRVCLELVDAGTNGGKIGNGSKYREKVYKVYLDVQAQKQSPGASQNMVGSNYLLTSPNFLVTTDSSTPPVIKHCGGPVDNWTAITNTNTPIARSLHTAVWTGKEMMVWGGRDQATNYLNSGGLYDPVADSWASTTTTGAPTRRQNHVMIWTGSEAVVWGGVDSGGGRVNTGGKYSPANNSWIATETWGAPTAVLETSAVWDTTNRHMIIWGGDNGTTRVNTGGRYDAYNNQWSSTAMDTAGAPSARKAHTAVWTGSKMIVWGGLDNTPDSLNTGGVYTGGSTNSWTATSTTSAPSKRYLQSAVWTGTTMIIWGGYNGSVAFNTGGIYTESTNTWSALTTTSAPDETFYHTAIWTGSTMIIWGGAFAYSNVGGIYTPSTGIWTDTTDINPPLVRYFHTAVWTGSKMIIWGGFNTNALNDGSAYTPAQ